MKYLDTHQHLIYRDRFEYSWTNGIPALESGNFKLEDYARIANDRVGKTIFMECAVDHDNWQDETRFIASKVGVFPTLCGVIASCRPEIDAGYDAWLEECGSLPVVGFRRILHTQDDALSQSDHFRANIRKIGDAGLVFDLCFLESQLPIAYKLAKACDNTAMVLNHCGVPNVAGGQLETWKTGMKALASLPNVTCKLSGISAYVAPDRAGLSNYQPWVDAVLDIFGPDRMVWGSDWPVVDMVNGLPIWLDESDQILNTLSEIEAEKIAYSNAEKIYNIQ